MGAAVVQAANWRRATFAVLALVALEAVGLVVLGAQPKAIPHLIQVDKLGAAAYLGPLERASLKDFQPPPASFEYHLRRFVSDTREISSDVAVVQRNWLDAYRLVTQNGANQLNAYVRDHDPIRRSESKARISSRSTSSSPSPAKAGRWTGLRPSGTSTEGNSRPPSGGAPFGFSSAHLRATQSSRPIRSAFTSTRSTGPGFPTEGTRNDPTPLHLRAVRLCSHWMCRSATAATVRTRRADQGGPAEANRCPGAPSDSSPGPAQTSSCGQPSPSEPAEAPVGHHPRGEPESDRRAIGRRLLQRHHDLRLHTRDPVPGVHGAAKADRCAVAARGAHRRQAGHRRQHPLGPRTWVVRRRSNEQQHIYIKPTRPDLDTTLCINTDRRSYILELHSYDEAWMAAVAWRYPQDEVAQLESTLDQQQALAQSSTTTGVSVDKLNFGYGVAVMSGRPQWVPIQVFDDAHKTYIRFPAAMLDREAPALFVVSSTGDTQLVNYRVKNDTYIVDRLFEDRRTAARSADPRNRSHRADPVGRSWTTPRSETSRRPSSARRRQTK